jgi:hypothetical protein
MYKFLVPVATRLIGKKAMSQAKVMRTSKMKKPHFTIVAKEAISLTFNTVTNKAMTKS